MILGDTSNYYMAPAPAYAGGRLAIGQARLPTFDVTSDSQSGRELDRNEQSGYPSNIGMDVNRAVENVFRTAQGAPFTIAKAARFGAGFSPAMIGSAGRAYAPSSAKSVAHLMVPASAAQAILRQQGPGLTPRSPFRYGSRGGVMGAVPTKFMGSPSTIVGKVEVRGNPLRRQIRRGE